MASMSFYDNAITEAHETVVELVLFYTMSVQST